MCCGREGGALESSVVVESLCRRADDATKYVRNLNTNEWRADVEEACLLRVSVSLP